MFPIKIGRYALLSSEPSLGELQKNGFVVLCLHGMFGGAWYFEEWIAAFERAGFGALALDFRGHHDSGLPHGQKLGEVSVADYVSDVEAVLAALAEVGIGHERIILLGHSMGGLVAQIVAARHPPRALVLVATAIPVPYRLPFMPQAAGILKPAESIKTRRLFAGVVEPLLSQTLARLVPESGRAASEITAGIRVAEPSLRVPTLILAGTNDPIVPTTFLRWLHQHKRHSTYQEYIGGHFPMLEPGAADIAHFIVRYAKQAVFRQS